MSTSCIGGLALLAALCGTSRGARAGDYVFATFTGDAVANERLSIYRSTNALDFTVVANTGFSGPSGALRDPSIMRHTDGQYYVAYTDPLGAGCCGKEDHFSIARSADLVHWTQVTTVPGGVPGVAHVWAPEWFLDGGTVTVIANIDTLNNDTDFKPYVFTATDATLTSWSGPTPLGIGPNYIDAFVMKVKGTYHVFAKNESTRYVEHATAAKLTGPWTITGTGNWAGWGSGMEGPCVVELDDGTFRIYLDGQQTGFLYSNSPDLTTWSKTSPLPVLTDVVRHGTVLRDLGGGGAGGTGGATGTTGAGGGGAPAGGGGHSGGGGRPDVSAGGHAGRGSVGGAPGPLGQGGDGGRPGATGTGGLSGGGTDGLSHVPDAGGSSGTRPASDAAATSGARGAVSDGAGGCSCAIAEQGTGAHELAWLPLLLALGRRRHRRH